MNHRLIFPFILLILLCKNVSAQHEKSVVIQPGECWYGIGSSFGSRLPIKSDTPDCTFRPLYDVGSQYLISSHGRYVWCDKSYTVEKKDSMLIVNCKRADIELGEGGNTLRDAYMAVSKHFPPSGKTPPEEFFVSPTYNTWIELGYKQNQKGVMEYARGILANGLKPGVLMIDGTWQFDHGEWDFRADRFPNPKEMVDSLHAMGFKVMVWCSPFISPDCMMYRTHKGLYFLAKGKKSTAIINWWVGYSAGYGLTQHDANDAVFISTLACPQARAHGNHP